MNAWEGWTLVQHSGFGYKRDPQFERAVEPRRVTKMMAHRIERNGGVILTSYVDAEVLGEKINYPAGAKGLIPQAIGKFADVTVDGLKVYIPVREVVG